MVGYRTGWLLEFSEVFAQRWVSIRGSYQASPLKRRDKTVRHFDNLIPAHALVVRCDEEAITTDFLDDLAHSVSDLIKRSNQFDRRFKLCRLVRQLPERLTAIELGELVERTLFAVGGKRRQR